MKFQLFTKTLILGVILVSFGVNGDGDWSWGKDVSKPSTNEGLILASAPDNGRIEGGRKLETDTGNNAVDVHGRTLGFVDKISCKLGLKCKQAEVPYIEHNRFGPFGPFPYPAVPTPVISPVPSPLLPLPLAPNPNPINAQFNQGYPPIKPSKTEHHHQHIHTHIHQGTSGGIPLKGSGYPPKKDSPFTPTILTGHPEVNTGPLHHPSLYKQDCVCVLPHLCSPFDIVRKSGGGGDISHLLNPRSEGLSILSNDTSAEAQRRKRDTDVNERHAKSTSEDETLNARAYGAGGHSPGYNGCGLQYVCCRKGFNPHVPKPTCGKSFKSSIHGRIANTDFDQGTTQFGQYPWQGAILREGPQTSEFVCGATLVSSRHVLTAAHCLPDQSTYNLKVRLGDWDVNGEAEFYKHVELPVERITIHPQFYPGNLNNDIAILTLGGYVDFNTLPHVSPICLPNSYADFTGQHCYVTGWGKDAFGYQGQFQQILKEVDLPVVDRRTCQNALQRARLGPHYTLPQGFICAGGQHGKDTCEGDGGGPLVCPTGANTYELAGIVSWGIECGKQGVPGVYVNIPYYVDWIRSFIGVQ